jgi:hypothetical protein
MDFESLSPGSTATDAKYQNGIVSCLYLDNLTQCRYLIEFRTPRLRSCFFSCEPIGFDSCAKTKIDRLEELLTVKNRKYQLGTQNSSLRAARFGSLIAIGLRAEDYPYLASIRTVKTNITFIAVPISSLSDITVTEM